MTVAEHPLVARATGWWHSLSARERVLVGTLGALLALAVLVYGVVRPLQAARAAALADIRTYETLNARIRAAGSLGPAGPPPRTGPAASVIADSARSLGLAVQTGPTAAGTRATIADASYDVLVQWLADLARTSSLGVTVVDIRRGAVPGRVSATVDFTG